jgi:hypothetical protein
MDSQSTHNDRDLRECGDEQLIAGLMRAENDRVDQLVVEQETGELASAAQIDLGARAGPLRQPAPADRRGGTSAARSARPAQQR